MNKFHVFYKDWNRDTLAKMNILTESLYEDVKKNVKNKKITTTEELREWLKRDFMYHYWCKSEFEVVVSDLFDRYNQKIDIWYQIEPNLDVIVKLIKEDLKLKLDK